MSLNLAGNQPAMVLFTYSGGKPLMNIRTSTWTGNRCRDRLLYDEVLH